MKIKDSYTTYLFDNDDQVLVSTSSGEFAGLLRSNETAAFIIEQLRHDTTTEEIVQRMAQQFDAPPAVLECDVAAVVEKLAAIGALDGDDGTWGVADGARADAARTWTFEDELRERGTFVYRNVGTSMRPLIKQERDLVVIGRKPQGRCRKFDVVLYKRGGRYVLHRIVEVLPGGYVICGDNCIAKEYGITDNDIVGVMTAVVRRGRQVDADSPSHQRYARIWCSAYPLRASFMKVRALGGGIYRKIRGR